MRRRGRLHRRPLPRNNFGGGAGLCGSRRDFRPALCFNPVVVRLTLLLQLSLVCVARAAEPLAIDIDLAAQKAFLLQDGKIVYESPISSGRPGHLTPTGDFQVLEKDDNHLSSLYGRIVDADGKTILRDADAD